MLIGYARISKNDGSQLLDLQMDAIKQHGVLQENIFSDEASGADEEREGLDTCLRCLREGDVLIIWKLDRLSRRLKHLISIMHELLGRGVGVKILSGQGANIDLTTSSGRMFFGLFATFAEFERDMIIERTMAGLAAARARGRQGGRPPKMTKDKLLLIIEKMSDRNTSPGDLAKILGICEGTIYQYVNGDGSLKAKGQRFMLSKSSKEFVK